MSEWIVSSSIIAAGLVLFFVLCWMFSGPSYAGMGISIVQHEGHSYIIYNKLHGCAMEHDRDCKKCRDYLEE